MKKHPLVTALGLLFASPALSQTYKDSLGTVIQGVAPLVGCASNGSCLGPISTTNPLPVSGTFSATLGGFSPATVGTPITALTSGSSGALPASAGSVVVAQDVGANPAYCQVGLTVSTSGHYLSGAGAQWAFVVPSGATTLACEGVGGTTTINMIGGTGLAIDTGGGGGSGGGGGGTVTQGPGSSSNPWYIANFPSTQAVSGTVSVSGLGSPFQAGGSIGNAAFGISGTLPAFAATPTFNLGTLNGAATTTNQTAVQGSLSGGTAASLSEAMGGVYNTTSPTLTNGQQAAEQLDASGRQLVNGSTVTQPVTGTVTSAASGVVTNPTGTLTLPATTGAYASGNLIASSAAAGSIVVPTVAIANTAGGALIPRVRLSTNDTTSTSWPAVAIQVDLWSAPPTFANGDRGAFAVATGSASHLGAFNCTMGALNGDGVYAECSPVIGNAVIVKLASGTAVYWTLQAKAATAGATGASKVFTLTAETLN